MNPYEPDLPDDFFENEDVFMFPDGTHLSQEDIERILKREHSNIWGSIMWPVFVLILAQWFLLTYFFCIPIIDFAFANLQSTSAPADKVIAVIAFASNFVVIWLFAQDMTLTPFHQERQLFDRALAKIFELDFDNHPLSELDKAKIALFLLVGFADVAKARCRRLLFEALSRKVVRLLLTMIGMYLLFWLHASLFSSPI